MSGANQTDRSRPTVPRHVLGVVAGTSTRTICVQCADDIRYQKGQVMLMDAENRPLCVRCADMVEDLPPFVLRRNSVITNDPCGVCGARTDPGGYDVFIEWPGRSPELVCEPCITRYAASLRAARDHVLDDLAGGISAWEELGAAPEIRLTPERRAETTFDDIEF